MTRPVESHTNIPAAPPAADGALGQGNSQGCLHMLDHVESFRVGHPHALGRGPQTAQLLHTGEKLIGALAKKALAVVGTEGDFQFQFHT